MSDQDLFKNLYGMSNTLLEDHAETLGQESKRVDQIKRSDPNSFVEKSIQTHLYDSIGGFRDLSLELDRLTTSMHRRGPEFNTGLTSMIDVMTASSARLKTGGAGMTSGVERNLSLLGITSYTKEDSKGRALGFSVGSGNTALFKDQTHLANMGIRTEHLGVAIERLSDRFRSNVFEQGDDGRFTDRVKAGVDVKAHTEQLNSDMRSLMSVASSLVGSSAKALSGRGRWGGGGDGGDGDDDGGGSWYGRGRGGQRTPDAHNWTRQLTNTVDNVVSSAMYPAIEQFIMKPMQTGMMSADIMPGFVPGASLIDKPFSVVTNYLSKMGDDVQMIETEQKALKSVTGSGSDAQNMMEHAVKVARSEPVEFSTALKAFRSFSVFPGTREGVKSDPAFREELLDVVQRLAILTPEQGEEGAMFALRELMAGQERSIQRRFNIDMPTLLNAGGRADMSKGEFLGQSGETQIKILSKAMKRITGESALVEKSLTTSVQTNDIKDTMMQAFALPFNRAGAAMLTQGQEKDYVEVLMSRNKRMFGDSLSEPESRARAVKEAEIASSTPVGSMASSIRGFNDLLGRMFEKSGIGGFVTDSIATNISNPLAQTLNNKNVEGTVTDFTNVIQKMAKGVGKVADDLTNNDDISKIMTTLTSAAIEVSSKVVAPAAVRGLAMGTASVANMAFAPEGLLSILSGATQATTGGGLVSPSTGIMAPVGAYLALMAASKFAPKTDKYKFDDVTGEFGISRDYIKDGKKETRKVDIDQSRYYSKETGGYGALARATGGQFHKEWNLPLLAASGAMIMGGYKGMTEGGDLGSNIMSALELGLGGLLLKGAIPDQVGTSYKTWQDANVEKMKGKFGEWSEGPKPLPDVISERSKRGHWSTTDAGWRNPAEPFGPQLNPRNMPGPNDYGYRYTPSFLHEGMQPQDIAWADERRKDRLSAAAAARRDERAGQPPPRIQSSLRMTMDPLISGVGSFMSPVTNLGKSVLSSPLAASAGHFIKAGALPLGLAAGGIGLATVQYLEQQKRINEEKGVMAELLSSSNVSESNSRAYQEAIAKQERGNKFTAGFASMAAIGGGLLAVPGAQVGGAIMLGAGVLGGVASNYLLTDQGQKEATSVQAQIRYSDSIDRMFKEANIVKGDLSTEGEVFSLAQDVGSPIAKSPETWQGALEAETQIKLLKQGGNYKAWAQRDRVDQDGIAYNEFAKGESQGFLTLLDQDEASLKTEARLKSGTPESELAKNRLTNATDYKKLGTEIVSNKTMQAIQKEGLGNQWSAYLESKAAVMEDETELKKLLGGKTKKESVSYTRAGKKITTEVDTPQEEIDARKSVLTERIRTNKAKSDSIFEDFTSLGRGKNVDLSAEKLRPLSEKQIEMAAALHKANGATGTFTESLRKLDPVLANNAKDIRSLYTSLFVDAMPNIMNAPSGTWTGQAEIEGKYFGPKKNAMKTIEKDMDINIEDYVSNPQGYVARIKELGKEFVKLEEERTGKIVKTGDFISKNYQDADGRYKTDWEIQGNYNLQKESLEAAARLGRPGASERLEMNTDLNEFLKTLKDRPDKAMEMVSKYEGAGFLIDPSIKDDILKGMLKQDLTKGMKTAEDHLDEKRKNHSRRLYNITGRDKFESEILSYEDADTATVGSDSPYSFQKKRSIRLKGADAVEIENKDSELIASKETDYTKKRQEDTPSAKLYRKIEESTKEKDPDKLRKYTFESGDVSTLAETIGVKPDEMEAFKKKFTTTAGVMDFAKNDERAKTLTPMGQQAFDRIFSANAMIHRMETNKELGVVKEYAKTPGDVAHGSPRLMGDIIGRRKDGSEALTPDGLTVTQLQIKEGWLQPTDDKGEVITADDRMPTTVTTGKEGRKSSTWRDEHRNLWKDGVMSPETEMPTMPDEYGNEVENPNWKGLNDSLGARAQRAALKKPGAYLAMKDKNKMPEKPAFEFDSIFDAPAESPKFESSDFNEVFKSDSSMDLAFPKAKKLTPKDFVEEKPDSRGWVEKREAIIRDEKTGEWQNIKADPTNQKENSTDEPIDGGKQSADNERLADSMGTLNEQIGILTGSVTVLANRIDSLA